MVVQPTAEPVDLAAAAEYDKERQTIEKCLSKLSPPIVRENFHFSMHFYWIICHRFKILKVEVH
jgi:hypothetical protein